MSGLSSLAPLVDVAVDKPLQGFARFVPADAIGAQEFIKHMQFTDAFTQKQADAHRVSLVSLGTLPDTKIIGQGSFGAVHRAPGTLGKSVAQKVSLGWESTLNRAAHELSRRTQPGSNESFRESVQTAKLEVGNTQRFAASMGQADGAWAVSGVPAAIVQETSVAHHLSGDKSEFVSRVLFAHIDFDPIKKQIRSLQYMPLLHGDLFDWMKRPEFVTYTSRFAEIRAIVPELLFGLDDMHSQGFCHLDLRPDNILVSLDPTAAILSPAENRLPNHHVLVHDVGLARWRSDLRERMVGSLGEEDLRVTAPLYMSPEHLRVWLRQERRGEKEYRHAVFDPAFPGSGPTGRLGEAADLWALGIVVLSMLFEWEPPEGSEDSEHLNPIQSGDISEELDEFLGAVEDADVAKALSKLLGISDLTVPFGYYAWDAVLPKGIPEDIMRVLRILLNSSPAARTSTAELLVSPTIVEWIKTVSTKKTGMQPRRVHAAAARVDSSSPDVRAWRPHARFSGASLSRSFGFDKPPVCKHHSIYLDSEYKPESPRNAGEGWWISVAKHYHWPLGQLPTGKKARAQLVSHRESAQSIAHAAARFLAVVTVILKLPMTVFLSAYTLFLRSRTDAAGIFLEGVQTTKKLRSPSTEDLVAVVALAAKARAYTPLTTHSNRKFLEAGMRATVLLQRSSPSDRKVSNPAKERTSRINITSVAKTEVSLFNKFQHYLLEPTALGFVPASYKSRTAEDREHICATVLAWRMEFPFAPNYAFDCVVEAQSSFEGHTFQSPDHRLLSKLDAKYLKRWGRTL